MVSGSVGDCDVYSVSNPYNGGHRRTRSNNSSVDVHRIDERPAPPHHRRCTLIFGGQADISDSTFEGNTKGSVFLRCNHVSIVRTSFVGGGGESEGGGAFTTDCTTDVENGTFTSNVTMSKRRCHSRDQ